MKQTEAADKTDRKEADIIPELICDFESVKRMAKVMRFILSDYEYMLLLKELNDMKPEGQ